MQQVDERSPGEQTIAPAMLNVGEVAKMLACSTRTVYRLADRGRMPPPVRLGAMVRWGRARIESWIDEGCPDCRRKAYG